MSNNLDKISFDEMRILFYGYGYPQIIGNPTAVMVWETMLVRLSVLLLGKDMRDLNDDYLYLEFPFGSDQLAVELGMSRPTLSKAVQVLEEHRLIRVERGRNNVGISTIYFPLVLPVPSEIKIPTFFKLENIEEMRRLQEKRVSKISKTDYMKENIYHYRLTAKDNEQKKRRKCSSMMVILAGQKHGFDISSKDVEIELRSFISEQMYNIKHFETYEIVERALIHIWEAYNDKLDNLFEVVEQEIAKRIPVKKEKTKKEIVKETVKPSNQLTEIELLEKQIAEFDHSLDLDGSKYKMLQMKLKRLKQKQNK